MDNLDELVRFLVPISGDKEWHEAHVMIRETPRPDLEIGLSYATEVLFYGAKYTTCFSACVIAVNYYPNIEHFVKSLL